MGRKIEVRAKHKPMPTIIGAGITEQWYFTHLKFLYDYQIKVRPRFFGNETADGMAKKIAEVLNDGGTAICVFDADVSTWNEEEKKKLDRLRIKYAKNKNVILCDSLPAIEYWFLLHYENTNRFLGTSKAAMQALRKYMPDYDKTDGFLSNRRWVAEMSGEGKQDVACSRAEQFGNEGQSYSMIYKVFDAIK
ncbi:MAG: RloB family protein [Candidatus Cryptobacteroides sp.]